MFESDDRSPVHTLPNNSFLIASSSRDRFKFSCRSNATMTNLGYFIGLRGNRFSGNQYFKVTISNNIQPSEVLVSNSDGADEQLPITARQQGVYSCRIPDDNGVEIDINIGVYPSGFNSEYSFMICFIAIISE